MYPIFGSIQAEPKGMMLTFTSDLALPVVMLAFGCLFAGIMVLRSKDRAAKGATTMPVTYLLQGITLASALVILVSIFIPKLFESVINQRATIAIVAMMTLIYAARDIAKEIRDSSHGDHRSTHQDRR
jgi:hypothetical protein